ncbi:MAG: YceI family protein [Cytophagaceae bacterium]|nr:YceI family protein [Gemmatimonadaceae bacterium]
MGTTERQLVLDATNTTISFEVRWFGVYPIRGRFTRVHGVLELDDECITRASVRLDVEAASLSTGIALRDRHLRGPRFLFADLHPFISFRSTAVQRENGSVLVDGTLSLRGREASIRSAWPIDGGAGASSSIDIAGAFSLSRREFAVGVPKGLAGINPLFLAIADSVRIDVRMRVPAARIVPVLSAAAR